MNDRAISKAISNIHVMIIDFLIFIFLSLFIIFFTLRIGLDIDKLILPNLQLTKVYIKWNEKLFITIDQVNITKSNSSNNPEVNLQYINNIIFGIKTFKNWVEYVHVNKFQIDDMTGTFRYANDNRNYFKVNSDKFSFKSNLIIGQKFHTLNIQEMRYFDKNVSLSGNIFFDLDHIISYAALDLNINNFTHFQLSGRADLNNLDLALENTNTLSSVKEIVSLFSLPSAVTPWIDEYAVAKKINLSQASLHIDLKDEKKDFLKSIFAHLRLQDVEYTFQQESEPIKGEAVEIVFSEGKLYVLPVDATFYGYDIGKTWVYIDFNNRRIPLHIFIDTYASLDDNLLNVLKSYRLNIPLKQYSGSTHVKQYLKILLNHVEVSAQGKYQLSKGEISYKGVDFNVSDAEVSLMNSDLSLDNLILNYQDWAQVAVNGEIDLRKYKGTINLTAQKILVGTKKEIQLNVDKSPLKIKYFLDNKEGDRVELSPSIWNYNDSAIMIDPISTTFNLETLSTDIPTTYIEVNNNIEALLTGDVDFKHAMANFDVDLLGLNFKGIHTKQTNTPLKLKFDDNVKITSNELSRWSINGLDFILNPTTLEITPTDLNILDSSFNFNDIVQSNIDGYYNFLNKDGTFKLSNISIEHPKFGSFIDYKNDTKLSVKNINNELQISLPEFHAKFKTRDEGWYANIRDISKFANYSSILQEYNISKGSVKVHSKDGKKPYLLNAWLSYPYALIVQNNQPQYEYRVKAKINKENTKMLINNLIDVTVGDNIVVESKHVGYNFHEILRYLSEHKLSKSSNDQIIEFYASNSYIYISEDRRALADAIILKTTSDLTDLELYYKHGYANLEYKNQSFYLYGQDFNDQYMNALFALADMEHGTFSFAMSGNFNKFSGIARVDDTVIKDYVVLNNLLAFFNTIPSLASFKLPDYSAHGLKTIKAYTGFTYVDGNVSLNDITLDSKELDIKGKGYLDLNSDTLDIDLFLKTDLGTTLSKIPVVGYILLGDDGSISTSVNMSGDSANPKINNALAKDIISAPFNILKRTITYPFELFSNKKRNKN